MHANSTSWLGQLGDKLIKQPITHYVFTLSIQFFLNYRRHICQYTI